MSELVIYGGSDDLIETQGAVCDEWNHYSGPANVTVLVDDAVYTRLVMEYDPDGSGEWRVQPTSLGSLVTVVKARGEDEGDDDDGCPGYSDKAVVDLGAIEARRVNVRVVEADR